tara:strand:+ start:316 stop:657 length:342 start_codon:yes stop_codon:yes gene_type:complete
MGSRKRPKPAPATAQEKAFARRSEVSLDKEISEENRRKRLLLRNTLGSASLLSGFKTSGGGRFAEFSGTTFSSGLGGGSLLSGGAAATGGAGITGGPGAGGIGGGSGGGGILR